MLPAWVEAFVREAHLAHLALAVLLLEGVAVVAFRHRLGSRAKGLLANVATGIALMLVVRAALLDRPAFEIAGLFAVAFALHIMDMTMRLRSDSAVTRPRGGPR